MNKVELLGRLTKDPEIRYTMKQNAYTTFRLAVNRRYKRDEEQEVDFFNIVSWNGVAEFCYRNFKKGQQVVLVGRLQNRSYEDKDGKKLIITEVICEEAYFAGYNNNNTDNTYNTNNNTNNRDNNKENNNNIDNRDNEGKHSGRIDNTEEFIDFDDFQYEI